MSVVNRMKKIVSARSKVLQSPYDDPYKVLKRKEYAFSLGVNSRPKTISLGRLKHIFQEVDGTAKKGGRRDRFEIRESTAPNSHAMRSLVEMRWIACLEIQ